MVDEKKREELSTLVKNLDTIARAVKADEGARGALDGSPFSTLTKGESLENYYKRILTVATQATLTEQNNKVALGRRAA